MKINEIKIKQFIKDFEIINPFPETDLEYTPEVLRKLIYHNASCDPIIKELPFRDVFKALNEYIDERFQRFIKSNL